MNGWLKEWIEDYLMDNLDKLALPVLRNVVIPFLKEKAATTGNKLDDYAVRQLERILNDPEFVALVSGVG